MAAPTRAQAPRLSLEIPSIPQSHRIQLLSRDTSTHVIDHDHAEAPMRLTQTSQEGKTSDTLDSGNCPPIKLALCTEVLQALQDCFSELSSSFSGAAQRRFHYIVDDETATFNDVSKCQPDLVMNSHCSLAHIRDTFEQIKSAFITHDRFALIQLYQAICEQENRRQRQKDASERPVPTARERHLEALKKRVEERQRAELERQEVRRVQQGMLVPVRALWDDSR